MAFLAQEQYDASYYDPHVQRYLARTRFTRHRLANVFGLLGEVAGRKVLDVGCGMGTFSVETALRGGMAFGVDPAVPALRAARGLAQHVRAGYAAFVAADAGLLPLPAESMDAVVCADLTEHLDDETLAQVIRESARVLRPGGVFALYTPSPTHLFEKLKDRGWLLEQDPSHIGLRGMDELAAAVRAGGLRIERAYFRPTHLPVYQWLETGLHRVPGLGRLFRRRVCIAAVKPAA